MHRRPLLVLFIVLACALAPSRAAAHPADMYAQDLAVALGGSGLRIDWSILPGPFLADAVWAAADGDHNGSVSAQEARAWVDPFISGLSLQLDGLPVARLALKDVRWPASVDVLRTGEGSVQVTLGTDWPVPLSGEHVLAVHNSHLEANALNWFSLSASTGVTFARPDQQNGRLTLDLFFPPARDGLTSWTSGTPNLPVLAGTLSSAAGSSAASGASATNALTGLVKNVQATPLFLLTAFLLSLALGSLHALTPGHGKALVGAYLVGSQGRPRDAVLLGGIVTLTHTGSVLALGLVTLLASRYILPSLIVPWLELISGILVILFGLNLLYQRRRDLARVRASGPHVHPHQHPHPHVPGAPASTAQPPAADALQIVGVWNDRQEPPSSSRFGPLLGLRRGPVFAGQRAPKAGAGPMFVNFKSLLALGISGGLVPCPDAIAILLVAVALNRVPFGMLLIVAFSIGLAAVLIAIGLAMVHGVRLISRSDWLGRFSIYAPLVSALVVTGLGAGLTFNAWSSFRFSSTLGSPAGGGAGPSPGEPGVLYIAADASATDQLFLLPRPGDMPAQLTHQSDGVTGYAVSPDGRGILYSVFQPDGGSSLWLLGLDSHRKLDGSPRRVLDCPRAECGSPVWHPGGSQVVYERLDNTSDSGAVPRFSIWWLDLQSGQTRPVFQDAAFASTAPGFSPDGRWLSYISAASNTLVAYHLQDGRTLSVPLGSQAAIPAAWSPAGDALLFGSALPGDAAEGASGVLHVKVFNLAAGRITDLGGTHGETDYFAAWSQDGQWIAIDRNVPGAPGVRSSNQVWLVRPDGAQAHVLLNEEGASYSGLSWSPDGRWLLYSRYQLDLSAGSRGRFDVCTTDIATGETTVLVPGGDVAAFLP